MRLEGRPEAKTHGKLGRIVQVHHYIIPVAGMLSVEKFYAA
jgi:hypothetical protein